jgi:hypothetical protein
MSVLSNPKLMDAVRAADDLNVLPEFLEQLTKRVHRENRARKRVQHAAESLARYNRMARARGMPEKTSL